MKNANGMPTSCQCNASAVTAKYEAEYLIRQAQSKVALELTYPDVNSRGNSQAVNEAALGMLTSMRRYLEGTDAGVNVPGVNSAYLFSRAVVNKQDPQHPVYAIDYEVGL